MFVFSSYGISRVREKVVVATQLQLGVKTARCLFHQTLLDLAQCFNANGLETLETPRHGSVVKLIGEKNNFNKLEPLYVSRRKKFQIMNKTEKPQPNKKMPSKREPGPWNRQL